MSGFPHLHFNVSGGNQPKPQAAMHFMGQGNNENSDVKDLYRYYCFSPVRRTNKSKRHQRSTNSTFPPHSVETSSFTTPAKRSRVLLESSNHMQPGPPLHHQYGAPPEPEHFYDNDRMHHPYSHAMDGLSAQPPFGIHGIKTMNSHSSAWNERFQELLKYKAEFGDCLVPQRYPKNPQLGVWVNKQRAEYKLLKEGKKSSMTEDRIRTLESVGFVWAKRRKGQPTWDLKFDELTMYKHKHGDCLVPTKYAENPALGRWVSTQRAQYKLMKEGKPSTMTEERVIALERIGFVWRLQF